MTKATQINCAGLRFELKNGQFTCLDLAKIPASFLEAYDVENIESEIENRINHIRDSISLTTEEGDPRSKTELKQEAQELFDQIIVQLKVEVAAQSIFLRFMFWLGNWWYYSVCVPTKIRIESDCWVSQSEHAASMVKKYIWPLFPDSIKTELDRWEMISAASDFGHFGLLFKHPHNSCRRVVTDTQLIHLDDVYGYNYMDMQPDGRVFLRSKTDHASSDTRAFFDGFCLMNIKRFQTCAPKVFFFDGGYKVNSTECTIINGAVYSLIDKNDEVAYTTGSCGLFGSFSFKQLQAGIELSQLSTKFLSVIDGQVFLGQTKLKAVGQFLPSEQTLLDSGFVKFSYSQYVLTNQVLCDSVLIVDDSQNWMDRVKAGFEPEISSLEFFLTSDSQAALAKIAESEAEVIFLDMHLTHDERFDGLWIIKELAARGYKGRILICSSYGDEVLNGFLMIAKAYLKNVEAPGKNLEKIRQILSQI